MTRNHRAGAGRHAHAARGNDCYETPECAVRALLKVERLPKAIWEPACGRGAIVQPLEAAGYYVLASDLIDYGQGYAILNFFALTSFWHGAIVTNPPYKDAAKFVRHGLTLAPTVVMLLRLAFLESVSRSDILDNGRLARVYVFRNRLPMMHRAGWTGPKASSSIAYAWFVWECDHSGPAALQRITWEA